VMVHSVHYRLEPVPATLSARRSVFDRLSIRAHVKPHKKSKTQNFLDLPSTSVNMIGRGREPLRGRRGREDTNSPYFSSPDSDYSTSLGQVLVGQEGVFRGTRYRVAIPYNYEQPSSLTGVMSPQLLKILFQWSDDEGEASDMPLQQQSALCKQAECRLTWLITTIMTFANG